MIPLRAYIINLDRAPERWEHMRTTFTEREFPIVRVPAVDGNQLTLSPSCFDEKNFRRFHGRKTNVFEVACYLSHLKAMHLFLESDDQFAMICEDDIFVRSGFQEAVEAALASSQLWNILRLTGLRSGRYCQVQQLSPHYFLTLHLSRLKGAGAYLIDRKAASILVKKLLPMWLPWDHAIDREWIFGLKTMALAPFPISQTDEKFESAIQTMSQPKCSSLQRCLTTYPYQILNELSRWICRGSYLLKLKTSSFFPLESQREHKMSPSE